MRSFACVVLAVAAGVAWGQQFSVQDGGGKTYGPFELKEGNQIKAGKTDLKISNVKTAEDAVLDRLNKIRLPAVEFQDASLEEVVNSLRKASAEADPEKKGVNLVLDLGGGFKERPADEGGAVPANSTEKLSFGLKDISLRDGLGALEFLAGMKYRIRGDLVVVCPTNTPDGPIVVRRYDVLASFRECAARTRLETDSGCWHRSEESRYDLKGIFADMGVNWPIGSYIKHIPSIGKVIVANTEPNLLVFEKLIQSMDVVPSEIQIEVDFVAFDKADIAKLGPGGVSQESLIGLWTNGHAELISAPRVIAKSGQEATIKGVTECMYPTKFVPLSGETTNTNTVVLIGGGIVPSEFVTREVGVILAVMCEVSPEGNLLNIVLTPEFVQEPVWRKYPAVWVNAKGEKQIFDVEQPFFHTHTVTTQATVFDGSTLLVGGGIPARDERKMIFAFLTARLVDCHGKPLRGR